MREGFIPERDAPTLVARPENDSPSRRRPADLDFCLAVPHERLQAADGEMMMAMMVMNSP